MSILEVAVGLLAPPECINCGSEGASLCSNCSAKGIIPYGERCFGCGAISNHSRTCPNCRRTGAPAHVWITTNHQGLARDLLHAYKFEQQRAAADSIAGLMIDTYLQYSHGNTAGYLVIPVPTATRRVRERGFDHSALLAKKISEKLRIQNQPVLGRLGQTRQVGSKRADRLVQMNDRLWVRKPQAAACPEILLIDDVVTTGATLKAASRALRQAGAKRVDSLVFAKRL